MKNLIARLQSNGFSWQHEDYFLLKDALPRLEAIREAAESILMNCNPIYDECFVVHKDIINKLKEALGD